MAAVPGKIESRLVSMLQTRPTFEVVKASPSHVLGIGGKRENQEIEDMSDLEQVINQSRRLSWEAKREIKNNILSKDESPIPKQDRYRVLAYWDEGAWGRVYVAWDTTRSPENSNAIVAIKVLKDKEELSDIAIQQMDERGYTFDGMREQEDFGQKNIDGVVSAIRKEGFGETYFVMKFYETFLKHELEEERYLDKKEWGMKLLSDLSFSLANYTRANVVHGDVSPDNIAKETVEGNRYCLSDNGIQTLASNFDNESKRTEMGFKYTRSLKLFTDDKTVKPDHCDSVFAVCSQVWKVLTGEYFLQKEIDNIENTIEETNPDKEGVDLYMHQRESVNYFMEEMRFNPEKKQKLFKEKFKEHKKEIPSAIRKILFKGLSGEIEDGVDLEKKVNDIAPWYSFSKFINKNARKLVIGSLVATNLFCAGLFLKNGIEKLPTTVYNVSITPTTQRTFEVGDTNVVITPGQEPLLKERLLAEVRYVNGMLLSKSDKFLVELVAAYKLACTDEESHMHTSRIALESQVLGGYGGPELTVSYAFKNIMKDFEGEEATFHDLIMAIRDYPLIQDRRIALRTEMYMNLLLQQSDLKEEYTSLKEAKENFEMPPQGRSSRVKKDMSAMVTSYISACHELRTSASRTVYVTGGRAIAPTSSVVENKMRQFIKETNGKEFIWEDMVDYVMNNDRKSKKDKKEIAELFEQNFELLTNSPFSRQDTYQKLHDLQQEVREELPTYEDVSNVIAAYKLACEDLSVSQLGERGNSYLSLGIIDLNSGVNLAEDLRLALTSKKGQIDMEEVIAEVRMENTPLNATLAVKVEEYIALQENPPYIGEHVEYTKGLEFSVFD